MRPTQIKKLFFPIMLSISSYYLNEGIKKTINTHNSKVIIKFT